MSTKDPLEGYRARTDEDDENEEIVRGIRGLAEAGIDYKSISDIIHAQDLRDALNEDKVLARLVDYSVQIIKQNTATWTASNDPDSLKKEHLEARAANLILVWAESIAQTGVVAEQLIRQQDTDDE